MLTAYILLFVIWLGMLIKFAVPIIKIISLNNPHAVKIIVYGGMIVLGTAYLYRLIHLVIYWSDGAGVHLFEVFYLVLKNVGEAVITTMLVAISWGWTIVHLNPSQYYIIIGAVSTLINIVSLVLSSLTEEHEHLYHYYDTIPGFTVLMLRIIVFLIFSWGISDSRKRSAGQVVSFINKFAVVGGIYLLSWPVTVLVVESFFPVQMHRYVITFVEEVVHICACTILCEMVSNQESSYRKVSMHQDDTPLGMADYKHK